MNCWCKQKESKEEKEFKVIAELVELELMFEKTECEKETVRIMMQHNEDYFWGCVSRIPNIPIAFIEKHIDDYKDVFYHFMSQRKFSEEIIEKHINRIKGLVMINDLSSKQILSESFIEKHEDIINWSDVIDHQQISEEFIEKHILKFGENEYIALSYRKNLSSKFIKKHLRNMSLTGLLKNNFDNLPTEWQLLGTEFKFNKKLTEEYLGSKIINFIYGNITIPVTFIEKHIDEVGFRSIYVNQRLPEWFLEKYIDKFDSDILNYQNVSEKFLEKHMSEYKNWSVLIPRTQVLTEKFIERHKNFLDWDFILKFQDLSESFIYENLDKIDLDLLATYFEMPESFLWKHHLCKPIESQMGSTTEDKIGFFERSELFKFENGYVFGYVGCGLQGYDGFRNANQYKTGKIFTSKPGYFPDGYKDVRTLKAGSRKTKISDYYEFGSFGKRCFLVRSKVEDVTAYGSGINIEQPCFFKTKRLEVLEEIKVI